MATGAQLDAGYPFQSLLSAGRYEHHRSFACYLLLSAQLRGHHQLTRNEGYWPCSLHRQMPANKPYRRINQNSLAYGRSHAQEHGIAKENPRMKWQTTCLPINKPLAFALYVWFTLTGVNFETSMVKVQIF